MNPTRIVSSAVLSLLCAIGSAQAATVLDDTYADGNSQNQDLPNNSAWLFNGRSANTRTDAVGSVAFAITQTGSEGFWAFFTDAGAPISLGVGDRLDASMTFSVSGFVGTGQDIRGGLFDSAGTRNTANKTGGMNDPSFADDYAYGFQFYASGSGSPFVAYERNAPGSTVNPNNPFNTFSVTDWTPLTTDAIGATERTALENGVSYTITYSVLRATDTDTVVAVAVTGGSLPAGYNWTATDVGGPLATFDCVAIRIGGSGFATGMTISNVKVVLTPATPVITAQPTFTGGLTTLTVGVGGQTTLTVAATGQNLQYQWKRDGNDVAGGTATTLALSNLQLADSGAYTVVVSNGSGSVTSDAITLTVSSDPVDPAPVIDSHPSDQTVTNGQDATFSVAVTGNNVVYQWTKDGSDISGANGPSLTVTAVDAADAGSYRVTVSNSGGNVTSNAATLTVLSPTLTFSSFTPATDATGAFPDTSLSVAFGSAPTLGATGMIRIHDASDDSVVDTIDLATGTVGAGASFLTGTPYMTKTVGGVSYKYYPVVVSGNAATLYPRNGALSYNKTYYVTIDPGVFLDATGINAGIADATTWRFSTKASGPTSGATQLTVAADGSGDFLTLQAALDFVPAANTTPTTILIKDGTYFELVYFNAKHNITLQGESVAGTTLVYPNNNNLNGAGNRSVFYGNSVRDLLVANMTIRNSTPQNGSQAEAIIIKGSTTIGQNIFHRVSFYSYQDTLQIGGQCYLKDCYIEGDVDFMWGGGPCFFENCDIRILRSAGYFTQIRNPAGNHGYVYSNCRFTAPDGITGTFLGRIDPAGYPYSEVVLVDCAVGDATNNAVLATTVGTSGSNYLAGWWLLNNAADASTAGNIRYWDNATVDGTGAPLSFADRPGFTVMPTDATTQANYRDPVWVLNTAIDGTVNSSWTPAHVPLVLSQPVAITLDAGLPATFSVDAIGIDAPTFQWRKNGVEIVGANAATYTIDSVAALDAGAYTVVVANSAGTATSGEATLTVTNVGAAPSIVTQPLARTVTEGYSFSLSVVAAGDPPLAYQWQKSTDGSGYTNIAGAESATFAVAAAQESDGAFYRVEVTNGGGSVLSDVVSVTVNALGGATVYDGYAAAVTGGAAGSSVTVTTAAGLESYAESSTPYTITVSGVIDLGPSGRINVQSNKTIQGLDVTSTVIGTLNISGASNVIIRNLNVTAPTGEEASNDGITIHSSTNVLVTKCTIYDCMDGCLDVVGGSDLVTVSWCKFYYHRDGAHKFVNLIGSSDTDTGAGDGLTNYRISWHHNWWAEGCSQRMLACRFGSSHMYNNYWNCTGNDYCTESRNIGSILSEHNYYDHVEDPLGKRTALETDVGLLMTIGNVFDTCTGSQLVSSDVVFTPPYSYPLLDVADVPAIVMAGAGNVGTDVTASPTAAISGPSGSAVVTQDVVLTAAASGFVPVSYQWRFRNQAITGATAATLAIAGLDASDTGDYTVVLGLADGGAIVSAPYRLAVSASGAFVQGGDTSVTAGGAITLTAQVQGDTAASYQWQLDGINIAGATGSSFALPSVQAFHAGTYTVVVGLAGGGSFTSAGSVIEVAAPAASASRLMNISARALCQTGDDVLIPGFVINGTGTKQVLLRAAGPELAPMGVGEALPDPQMVLRRQSDGQVLGSNDNWGDNANAAEIAAAAASVWAFAFNEGSTSAAMLVDLPAGSYTLVCSGKGSDTGVEIAEVYDISGDTDSAHLGNISNRGYVGVGGNIMIPGFIISEEGSRTFLIRAVGPTLGAEPFNVPGTLADPILRIFDKDSVNILTNDNWGENGDAAAVAATAASVWAFALQNGSADAAFVVTLPPGAYTVQASGVGETTGVALVEVYLVE